MSDFVLEAEPGPEKCKGRFFRYLESNFVGKNDRVVVTKELRPLRSLSCSGCNHCYGMEDDIREGLLSVGSGFIQIDRRLAPGDTAQLVLVPVACDHDTGALEEWYYEARPMV